MSAISEQLLNEFFKRAVDEHLVTQGREQRLREVLRDLLDAEGAAVLYDAVLGTISPATESEPVSVDPSSAESSTSESPSAESTPETSSPSSETTDTDPTNA